jgi:hypothetical protein
MTESSIALPLPDYLIGKEFYKLGYVTTDRERAIEHFQTKLGFEEFVSFEPTFEAELPDGRKEQTRLRCAFSAGRPLTVEVMEPVEGLVDLWARPLRGAGEFAIAFHHFGLLNDDMDAVKAAAAAYGLEPVLSATIPVGTFAYWKLPGLGHYIEHMQYFGEGGAFLEGIRTKEIRRR